MVKLLLQDNWTVLLAHLDGPSPLVKGQTNLGQDTYIGRVGQSGTATGVHIHFEIYMDRSLASTLALFGYTDSPSWRIGSIVQPNSGGSSDNPTPPNPPAQPDAYVSLHDDNNGGGETVLIRSIPVVASGMEAVGFLNDRMGSLTIHKDGISVRVWVDGSFQGHSMEFSTKGVHNLPLVLDNNVSSIKVYPSGQEPSNPSQPQPEPQPTALVEFYAAAAGRTSGTGPDEWNYSRGIGNARTASALGFPNDELSSLRILDDTITVELFADDNYQGTSRKFVGKGFYDLRQGHADFDDKTSSYRIYGPDGPVSDPEDSVPAPSTESYEVRSIGVDSAGNLSLSVINTKTGASGDSSWRKGPDGSFIVRFPDNTTFTINPSWGVEVLHTNPAFASGAGGVLISAGILEFRAGQTVTFGQHNGAVDSCTLWLTGGSTPGPETPQPNEPPEDNPGGDGAEDNPGSDGTEDNPGGDGEENNSGGDGTTIEIPEHITISGGGCNNGLTAAAFALVLLYCLRRKN
jgi:hypothetical protein